MHIFVNNQEQGLLTQVTNGDGLRVRVCSVSTYGFSEVFTLRYGEVAASITVSTPILVPVTFDGQTYIACSGDSVDVTFNGYHNIRETATNAACVDYIGSEINDYKNSGSRVIFDYDELTASPGETRYFNCELHCGSKFAITCPLVVSIDGIDILTDETYPERVKYTWFAVYAETELATMPWLLELQINLADGSQVNGTKIDRIDSTNIAMVSVFDLDILPKPLLFNGAFTRSGFNAYRDTPGPLYAMEFNTAFAVTGGRLLCDGVAIPLALYGSNEMANWTRVAALDVVSVARNYGCGENTVQSCAHLPFGAAPRGAHVFRFAATDILHQSDTPLYVRNVKATLADGTEYLFPASEFSFIAPRVAKPASPVAAAGLPAIVHVIPFARGSWVNAHEGYTYRKTLGDLYVYGLTTAPENMVYDLQYNTSSKLWSNYGTWGSVTFTYGNANTIELRHDNQNILTGQFVDPYAPVQDVSFTSGHWKDNSISSRYTYRNTLDGVYFYALDGFASQSRFDIWYNPYTKSWGQSGDAQPHYVVQTGRTVVLSGEGIANVATFIDPYYAIVQDVYFTSGHWGGGYRYIKTQEASYVYGLCHGLPTCGTLHAAQYIRYDTVAHSWKDLGNGIPSEVVQTDSIVLIRALDQYPNLGTFIDPYYVEPVLTLPPAALRKVYYTGGYYRHSAIDPVFTYVKTQESAYVYEHMLAMSNTVIVIQYNTTTALWEDGDLDDTLSVNQTEQTVEITNDLYPENPAIVFTDPYYGAVHVAAQQELTGASDETVGFAWPTIDGTTLFSLTTAEPIHRFMVTFASKDSTVAVPLGVDVYRDDVLISAASASSTSLSSISNGTFTGWDAQEHVHRVSHFLAVVGSGTNPSIAEFRATYGKTRLIAGPNDEREIMETTSLISPRVDYVFAEGIANMPNMPQSGFDGDRSTVLHKGSESDAFHAYYYAFGEPVDATSFEIVNVYTGSVEAYAYDNASLAWVWLGNATSEIVTTSHVGEVLELHFAPVHSQYFKLVAYPHDNNPDDKKRHTGFSEWIISGERGQLSLNGARNNYRHETNSAKQYESAVPMVVPGLTTDGSFYYAALTRAATDLDLLFDGSLEINPTDALQVSGTVSDRILFYAEVPKNVIPNYGEVWSDGLTHAALYFAQEVPQDASNVALWYKLVDLKRYAGYARVIGANPLYATTGAYAELGAEAVKVNGEVDTSVILEASKLPSELGVDGAHVVSYGGKRMNYSLAERDVRVGPIGPSVDGAGAPDISETVGFTTWPVIEVSQYFTAGSGTTLRYEASIDNNRLVWVTFSGNEIRIEARPNVTGTVVITVKAIANEAYAQPSFATLTFQYVIASNGAPTTAVAIPDVQGKRILNLTNYFSDADPGHQANLVYTFTNGDPDVLNATLVGGKLHLENGLFRDGTSDVVVTATDPAGASVNDTFTITFVFSTGYEYRFVVSIEAEPMLKNGAMEYQTQLKNIISSSYKEPISVEFGSLTLNVHPQGVYGHAGEAITYAWFSRIHGMTLFTINTRSRMTDISIGGVREMYTPGYEVYENNVLVTASTDNGGLSAAATTITLYWGPPRPTPVPQVMFTSGAWPQPGVGNKPDGFPGYMFYETQDEHLYVYNLIYNSEGRYNIVYNTLSKTWLTASGVTQPGEVAQFENMVTLKTNPGDTSALGVFIDPYYVTPSIRYGGPNLVSAMPSVLVDRHAPFKAITVASHFNTTKLPASALRYYYSTNNHALLSITDTDAVNGTFNLVPKNTIGVALITVKAVAVERSVDTWIAETNFTVTVVVDDYDPMISKAFEDVIAPGEIDLRAYFQDNDDDLTYTVMVSNASVVTAFINGSSLTLENTEIPGGATAIVTVTARDSNAHVSSNVTVQFSYSTMAAVGGVEMDIVEDGISYRVHAFTNTGAATFDFTGNGEVEYLVVGGGGGGGHRHGGGGGAGGFVEGTLNAVSNQYIVSVGGGGQGSNSGNRIGNKGTSSVFDTVVGLGGGGGGSRENAAASSGGSGGGSGFTTSNSRIAAGLQPTSASGGFGSAGGGGIRSQSGGGGAGGPGESGRSDWQVSYYGGPGKTSLITGTELFYAAGGSSGGNSGNGGIASGIGGQGGNNPTSGTPNTGSGGGGCNQRTTGARGATGVVFIRYRL
jgi:hypothetical protein